MGSIDTGSAGSGARPLRADARRNRDAVLAAAVEAFSRHGVDAPLEDIARQAGVGIGTLYRHFPTREDLVFGVYRREVERLCEAADQLSEVHPPDEALRIWMQRFVEYAAAKRGMVSLLRTMMQDTHVALFKDLKGDIHAAVGMLLERGATAGLIRGDMTADELIRGLGGICMASDSESSATAVRLVSIVFDGMRFGAAAHH